jgi:Nuclease-related domain
MRRMPILHVRRVVNTWNLNMAQEDKRFMRLFFIGGLLPLLVVALTAVYLDRFALYLLPSLQGNPYFNGYQDVLHSFAFEGGRFLTSCVLIPIVFWHCDIVPKFMIRERLWQKWLKRELETEQSFSETVRNKWWRELALATPLYSHLQYQYRDQLDEKGRSRTDAENTLRHLSDQCETSYPVEQYRTPNSTITIITLSDHTVTLLKQAEQVRQTTYLAELEKHDHARELIRQRRELASEALRSAWGGHRIWGTYHAWRNWKKAMRVSPPAAPLLQWANQQEQVWAAGNNGEELVLKELKRRLAGTWTIAKGYRNHKGEIDLVAMGLDGIVALEIKYLSGVVHCDGDRWYRDKYDNYGNLIHRGVAIEDGGGRAPSRQLNEAADALQTFLHQAGISGNVLRVVVLSHDLSQIGTLQNQTVDRICRVRELDLSAFCRGRCTESWPSEIEKAVSLVQKDHAYHNKPRAATAGCT